MKTRERIFTALAVSLLIAGAPALAQETPASTTQNTAQEDVIGPPQLSGFSLNGTVTRSAPAPVEV
ncbi:MAG TPA: hypothetical protein VFP53_01790, partial [Sphingomicrobium sp.]|nr:hypothetical protein [Sphingomicrobium sp.]